MYVLFSMYTTNISEFNISYISIFMYLGLMKLDFDMTGIVLFPFVFFSTLSIGIYFVFVFSSSSRFLCAWSVVIAVVIEIKAEDKRDGKEKIEACKKDGVREIR